MSLKEQLFNAKKNTVIPFEINEWQMTVYLRRWTLSQRSKFIEWSGQKTNNLAQLCEVVLPLTLCEETGQPVLKPEEWVGFADHDGEILERICLEALRLNGFNQQAIDAKKNN